MIEVRFHGRGGQGAVIASKILASAAFREGKDVQAFPFYGVERRGAPVTAFTKIDSKPIRNKSQIYDPDYVVVLDPSLIVAVDIALGVKENGIIVVNTQKTPFELGLKTTARIVTVDARGIALKHGLGSRHAPIVNSAILGAFTKATGEVKLESLLDSIREWAPAKKEENVRAAEEAYNSVEVI